MFFLLRFCLGLVLLSPAVVSAQLTASLEIPGNGATLSGIGVISGWKCEAEGNITVSLNGGAPFPATYGLPRTDTSGTCNNDGNNGFFSYTNWGNLDDGEHTAVVYDNGVEFARSTFTVVTTGVAFLAGASKRVTVENFPYDGDTAVLEWNQSTQHFEIVEFMSGAPDVVECEVGLTLMKGESCTGSVLIINYIFSVNDKGEGCIGGGTPLDGCWAEPALLPTQVTDLGVDATKNADGSWTIESLPGQ